MSGMKTAEVGPRNDLLPDRVIRALVFAVLILVTSAPPLAAQTLHPQPPVELTGTHGKFDFIKVDETRGRLLACHTGNGSLDVIDESTSKLIKSIPTGAAQGVAIDHKSGRYFVSCSKPPQLVIVDAAKLEATGTVALSGPADLCAFCGYDGCVYVDSGETPEMWTIDLKAEKVVGTKKFASNGMEDITSSPFCLLQNLKDASELASIQMVFAGMPNLRPTGIFSTLPAEKPHGLALAGDDKVLIAGGNGKLVLMNFKTGQVIASADIAPRVDEIGYDPGTGKAFCASGTGVISVVSVGKDSFGAAETIPSAQGAHSIAVDSKTHTVWIAFARDDKPCVQSFLAGKI